MNRIVTILIILFLITSCERGIRNNLLYPHKVFIDHITLNDNSFYSTSIEQESEKKETLSIGVFDSGIGGLTVFDAILNADCFDESGKNIPDGIKDFVNEQFIYLADQANMPYSNYVEEGKKGLLEEHILKDGLFLINNKYNPTSNSPITATDKESVKAIVIACNTATAYGKGQLEELCQIIRPQLKIIGVIDAGCKGALATVSKNKNVTVAVLATPATVNSMAYVNTLKQLSGNDQNILIIQQGGKGLHESIDNKPLFIRKNVEKPYPEYMGPSIQNPQYKIHKELLAYYNFDTTNFNLLFNKNNPETSDAIQINSVDNYVRFHIVSLMEQLRTKKDTFPLQSIILGCTHYPYVADNINRVLNELRKYEQYSYLLSDSIYLVDPALNTAKELYSYLSSTKLLNREGHENIKKSKFFVSIPNSFNPEVETIEDGKFSYQYQYKKRKINELKDYTLLVPFSSNVISEEQMQMVRSRLPGTYELLKRNM